jgi:hypothetical protein
LSNETRAERSRRAVELELDRQLEDTFPASDAPKITRRKPDITIPEVAEASLEDESPLR